MEEKKMGMWGWMLLGPSGQPPSPLNSGPSLSLTGGLSTCLHAALPLSGLGVPDLRLPPDWVLFKAETSLMFFVISSLPCYHPLQGSVSTTRLWAGLGWAGQAQLNVLGSARASQEEPKACLSEKILGLCIIIPEFNLDSTVF